MVGLKLFRFDPGIDLAPTYKVYEAPYESYTTVLDLLEYINEHEDPFSFQRECKTFKCGSCTVNVNGRPVLACKEKVQNLRGDKPLVVEPLSCFPLIKDLLVDFSGDLEDRSRIRPFPEFWSPRDVQRIKLNKREGKILKEYAFCIRCGACMEICPALKENPGKFAGPLYLLDVARLFFDPRDKADRRLEAVTEGIECCDGCKKCNEVCPVNLDVFEMAVGGLKRKIKWKRRTQKRKRKR